MMLLLLISYTLWRLIYRWVCCILLHCSILNIMIVNSGGAIKTALCRYTWCPSLYCPSLYPRKYAIVFRQQMNISNTTQRKRYCHPSTINRASATQSTATDHASHLCFEPVCDASLICFALHHLWHPFPTSLLLARSDVFSFSSIDYNTTICDSVNGHGSCKLPLLWTCHAMRVSYALLWTCLMHEKCLALPTSL